MKIIDTLFQKYNKLHFSLIDPSNQPPKRAGQLAITCENYGTDAFLVGGSTVKKRREVEDTVAAIKKVTTVPVILFPNSAKAVSKNADGILFTYLLNSLGPKYKSEEQNKAEPLIQKWGLEKIPTGYIIVSTSSHPTTVEKKAHLDKIYPKDIDIAIRYVELGIREFDIEYVYFEAGSGAEQPVSDEIISAIKKRFTIPIIVGGGINDGEIAYKKIRAGADIIVTGTVIEKNPKNLENIIKEIHKF